jgi:hypothetical protein
MKNYLFNIIFVSGILFVALSAYLLLSSRIFSPYCITIGLIGVYLLFASSVLCLFSQHQIYFKLTLGLFNLVYCTGYNLLLITVYNITDSRILILQSLALLSMVLPVLTIAFNKTYNPNDMRNTFRLKLLNNKHLG